MDKLSWIDSVSTFIHHKKPSKFCFVGLKCKKCCDLRAFLGVKSGLPILVRVKDLTFCNSGYIWLQTQLCASRGAGSPLGVITIPCEGGPKVYFLSWWPRSQISQRSADTWQSSETVTLAQTQTSTLQRLSSIQFPPPVPQQKSV